MSVCRPWIRALSRWSRSIRAASPGRCPRAVPSRRSRAARTAHLAARTPCSRPSVRGRARGRSHRGLFVRCGRRTRPSGHRGRRSRSRSRPDPRRGRGRWRARAAKARYSGLGSRPRSAGRSSYRPGRALPLAGQAVREGSVGEAPWASGWARARARRPPRRRRPVSPIATRAVAAGVAGGLVRRLASGRTRGALPGRGKRLGRVGSFRRRGALSRLRRVAWRRLRSGRRSLGSLRSGPGGLGGRCLFLRCSCFGCVAAAGRRVRRCRRDVCRRVPGTVLRGRRSAERERGGEHRHKGRSRKAACRALVPADFPAPPTSPVPPTSGLLSERRPLLVSQLLPQGKHRIARRDMSVPSTRPFATVSQSLANSCVVNL